MTDFERRAVTPRVHDARHHIADRWSPAREALIGRQLDRRMRRTALARKVGVACLVLLIGGGVGIRLSTRTWSDPAITLSDGSRVELRSKDATVSEVPAAGERRVRLATGSARFDVRHDPLRPFVVELPGSLEVRVLGTVFRVEPDATMVAVSVERGHVLVQRSGATVADLHAGEHARVPIAAPTVDTPDDRVATVTDEDDAPQPQSPSLARAPVPAKPLAPRAAQADWRALADAGDFPAAYAALSEGRVAGVDALLSAADVARLSGHLQESVAYLQRIETRHATDPRAPLAAFTRGRVLLEDLGRPRDAALAFERVRVLDPSGPLVADALAREVESWSRAGERSRAHACAEHYIESFPTGARLKSVRLYGDLD